MLDSLHIQNYRLFKDLKIEKLGQVNLIAGKNNSGKTALLEALLIFANEASVNILSFILKQRDEILFNQPDDGYNLFNDKNNKVVLIENGSTSESIKFAIELDHEKDKGVKCPFKYGINNIDISFLPIEKSIFVPLNTDLEFDSRLWDLVSLTPLEDDVVNILRIIEPKLDKFRFDNKKTKILIKGQTQPIPLKKAGEGINRLLSLALALVNAKNKMLLIDEFEVGLHHSVQIQLWEIIFKYAQEWNIQVFVTTHSLDTVRAFAAVSDKNEGIGEYMRLQKSRTTGDIEAVIYSKKSLEYAIEDSLEMR